MVHYMFLISSVGTLVESRKDDDTPDIEMTDDELLLTPAVVHGFSLSDKVWCMFTLLSFPSPGLTAPPHRFSGIQRRENRRRRLEPRCVCQPGPSQF